MPFTKLAETEDSYLRKSINDGRVVLILGAGASAACKNRAGPVPVGKALASLLAEKAGLPYDGETLTEVLAAVTPILGDAGCHALYKERFLGVEPCNDLKDLFN